MATHGARRFAAAYEFFVRFLPQAAQGKAASHGVADLRHPSRSWDISASPAAGAGKLLKLLFLIQEGVTAFSRVGQLGFVVLLGDVDSAAGQTTGASLSLASSPLPGPGSSSAAAMWRRNERIVAPAIRCRIIRSRISPADPAGGRYRPCRPISVPSSRPGSELCRHPGPGTVVRWRRGLPSPGRAVSQLPAGRVW